MEAVQEYLIPALQNASKYIPPSLSLQAMTYYSTFTTNFHSIQSDYLDPFILTPLHTLLNSPPDLYSIITLLAILFISLKVLDYARRVITFWVMLVFRLAFYGALFGGGYYVYSVGWERAAREAGWLAGVLQGFLEDLFANQGGNERGGAPPIFPGMRQAQAQAGWKRT
ncbi:hypothetical protein FQN53_006379 [Emmonsiellopsis sp. PD_33]|nr:hypothetical protein FQN53_006379 [Emmonsiellopsis sp. PD_33]